MDEEQQIIQEPFRSPPLRNNRIKRGYPDGGFSAGVCLFRRLRRREHYSAPDLLAGLEGCQPSGGQSRKEYSECPDFLGDLYGCGLSFMFDPDRVRARPVVVIAWIVFSIIAAVKAANGNYDYVAPFTIKFLK